MCVCAYVRRKTCRSLLLVSFIGTDRTPSLLHSCTYVVDFSNGCSLLSLSLSLSFPLGGEDRDNSKVERDLDEPGDQPRAFIL